MGAARLTHFAMYWIRRALLKTYTMATFMLTLRLTAPLARFRALRWFVGPWMRLLARMVHFASGSPRANNPAELATSWKDMMPRSEAAFRIAEELQNPTTDNNPSVASAEIHLHCPLRGTANPLACYHLMEYDRALARAAGGELMVLESQSNSGRDYCRVLLAMQQSDFPHVPAHER